MSVTVLALVGSLRAGSHNRQLAEAAVKHAPEGVTVVIYEGLADVPFYNEDIDTEGSAPAAAEKLRTAALAADAFLFVSPEYNGTITAVLKNAIDWLSRPFEASALTDKPAAVIGTAYGDFGGVWAHDETRKSLGIAGAQVLADAKLAIPESEVRFAELHPQDDTEVVEQLPTVLAQLAAAAVEAAPAV
jgi:NAD(P)H-dependent FMN reductase